MTHGGTSREGVQRWQQYEQTLAMAPAQAASTSSPSSVSSNLLPGFDLT